MQNSYDSQTSMTAKRPSPTLASPDMSNFSVGFDQKDDVHVLTLKGELDAHTASELEAALQKCQEEEWYHIIINGADLQYISSAGLGVFMAYIEDVREHGGDIKIAALQPKVYDVFDLLGFPMLFDIEKTEEEALAQFHDTRADT